MSIDFRRLRGLRGCLLVLAAASAVSGRAAASMRVHFIDVGQGAATLVELPCAALLIDTGSEETPWRPWGTRERGGRKLLDYLQRFFAARADLDGRLDLLILTHPHKDHTLNVAPIVETYRPRAVVYNGQSRGSGWKGQQALREYALRESVPAWFVRADTVPSDGLSNATIDPVDCSPQGGLNPDVRALWGRLRLDPGWGNDSFDNKPHFDDQNNHSLVVRITYGQAALLVTGDLELPAISDLVDRYRGTDLLNADLLQVGHHGSSNGTTAELLQAVSPRVAVIAAGQPCSRRGYSAWSHGHPRKTIVEQLARGVSQTRAETSVLAATGTRQFSEVALKKAVYSTGWDGHVVVELAASGQLSPVETMPQPMICD